MREILGVEWFGVQGNRKNLTMDSAQLNIFDQPTRINPEIVKTEIVDESCCGFEVGDRVQIQNAGVPLDKYNGDKGEIISIRLGLATVQIESLGHLIMFRCEALQKITLADG
jgi:hypothetical protein